MLSLPSEVQLDVLKSLNFTQLFSLKQANFYFCNLINKYEGELARMEFFKIDIWQEAIDNSIPLFLQEEDSKFALIVAKNSVFYVLNLENFPKSIEEMIIVRCWLKHLFKCAFEYCNFRDVVFNPEMINILFDNYNTIPTQFNIQLARFVPSNNFCKNLLDFVLTHLSICELFIYFTEVDIIEQYTDILFNILTNRGNRFPHVFFQFLYGLPALYDLIVEHITTKDCSKIVPYIRLKIFFDANFKLSERAEKVKIKQLNGVKYTNYQISNINYSKSRFYIYSREPEGESSFYYLKIMKE
ncbi:unnamed protein product [Meloidogyne enterolobii]|uniref:Uncharacterized protein n=1 Tax=Meloidogyne enterolobii TaxID=390850 RepID=A0ACB1ADU8_MELEN